MAQTSEKTDRSKNEKREEKKNENHSFKYKPQRAKGGFGPPFPHQITTNTPTNFQIF
jgi:hypothetical protein